MSGTTPMDTKPSKLHAPTTYYVAFPELPHSDSNLVHVFWVVRNDYRKLQRSEKRNIIYPAKRAGLIEDAPRSDLGFRLNNNQETSRCDFVLTEAGLAYYD